MKKINAVAAICAIMACFVYMQCKTAKPADPRGEAYAGAATCAKCHSANFQFFPAYGTLFGNSSGQS